MAEDGQASVRLPEVRRALLREVSILTQPSRTPEEDVAFGDAVEEVHHLLDPTHGGEPGDLLLDDAEVAVAEQLWQALNAAQWPLDPSARDQDATWAEVRRQGDALVAAAR